VPAFVVTQVPLIDFRSISGDAEREQRGLSAITDTFRNFPNRQLRLVHEGLENDRCFLVGLGLRPLVSQPYVPKYKT
jgi:hypothetical protein